MLMFSSGRLNGMQSIREPAMRCQIRQVAETMHSKSRISSSVRVVPALRTLSHNTLYKQKWKYYKNLGIRESRLRSRVDGEGEELEKELLVKSNTYSHAEGNIKGAGPNASAIVQLIVAIATVIVTAVVNRILYRMALVPLGNYVFFLAQFQTFGYVIAYALVLLFQFKNGSLHPKAWSVPGNMKALFLGIGFVEAVSSLLSFIGASQLPGVMIPLLSQTILLWQVVLVYLILRDRMSPVQLLGVATVIAGVGLAAWPASESSSLWTNVDPKFAIIYISSCLFPAIDAILKDRIFRKGKELTGGEVDLFIVNTFGSASQAFFVFLMLPLVTWSRGIPLSNLGDHVSMGWQCFQGISPDCGSNCSGAPLLPIMYVLINLLFNVSALNLIRQAGNIALSLVMSGIVPLTMWAFTLPLPLLGSPPLLGLNFLLGTAVLSAGLIVYNAPLWIPKVKQELIRISEQSIPSSTSSDSDSSESLQW
eukprot:jgi/Picsp_1/5850/NSC_03209-R1_crt homolog 1-like